VILTGRNPDRLKTVAAELGAVSSATFDADDSAALEVFFADLEGPIDHVMVTAGGPYYAPLAEMDFDEARPRTPGASDGDGRRRPARPGQGPPRRHAAVHGRHRGAPPERGCGDQLGDQRRPPGPRREPGARDPGWGQPDRAGFVDTPLSASLLGDQLEARRDELRATLPIGRVIGPADIAALAVHIMSNTALTGETYDIDGGQQLLCG
jgi:NAD(P)-dependent dehydrogenase (short-subunit alcohol dehydrogenase family)